MLEKSLEHSSTCPRGSDISPLEANLLECNAGRPKDLSDFDSRPGFGYLTRRSSDANEAVWSTSRWLRLCCLLVVLVLLAPLCWGITHSAEVWALFCSASWCEQGLQLFFGGLLSLVFVGCLIGTFQKAQLVVDRARRELRFVSGYLFPRQRRICLRRFGRCKAECLRIPLA